MGVIFVIAVPIACIIVPGAVLLQGRLGSAPGKVLAAILLVSVALVLATWLYFLLLAYSLNGWE